MYALLAPALMSLAANSGNVVNGTNDEPPLPPRAPAVTAAMPACGSAMVSRSARSMARSRPRTASGFSAASVRETKASVHEAIGKLIGDDAAEAQGTAEKQTAKSEQKKSRSPR